MPELQLVLVLLGISGTVTEIPSACWPTRAEVLRAKCCSNATSAVSKHLPCFTGLYTYENLGRVLTAVPQKGFLFCFFLVGGVRGVPSSLSATVAELRVAP